MVYVEGWVWSFYAGGEVGRGMGQLLVLGYVIACFVLVLFVVESNVLSNTFVSLLQFHTFRGHDVPRERSLIYVCHCCVLS